MRVIWQKVLRKERGIDMEINIPKKFRVGGVDYIVKQVEHCGTNDDFGLWRPQGIIEIANQAGGYEVSDSKKRQTFLHELTHAILFAMGKEELNDDESFVNTFSSFLNEAINTME